MEFYNTESPIQRILKESSDKINKYIERLVLQRIKERAGIDLDIVAESKRRFSRILIEQQEKETRYYWNDGTENGLLLITFYQKDPEFTEDFKMVASMNYL